MKRMSRKAFFATFLLIALLIAGVGSYYASAHPDGLNFVAEKTGFSDQEKSSSTNNGPLAGYETNGVDDARLSGGIAGVVGCLLVLTLAGDGFLRHMVRAIAGSLVEVGRGRWPAAQIGAILASKDRSQAGPTAPPHGLFLVSVRYC